MGRDDYTADWITISFDFFYWFARFEFALKENGFRMTVRKDDLGIAADWNEFQRKFRTKYSLCPDALALLKHPPKRQTLKNHECDWETLDLDSSRSDLDRVVRVLKTVRNNLFHGGKSSQEDYDKPEKNIFLLTHGKKALDHLARLDASLHGSYERRY